LAKADTAFQAHPLVNRLNLAWPCPREEALVVEEEEAVPQNGSGIVRANGLVRP
jgi:hypothetical protein